MRLHIIFICIMYIICHYEFYSQVPAHAHERLIHLLLLRDPVVLHLQKEISFSENPLILFCSPTCLFVLALRNIPLNLSCQAGAQGNDSFMIPPQRLFIHPRPIVKPFCKPDGHDLHQILISLVILCQQHQMIIPVLPACCLFVKTGIGSHIDFAAEDRPDSLCFCFLIKINHSIHNPMIRDSCTVHPQLLYTRHIFPDLIGAIQQAVFCMHMQMRKIHSSLPPDCFLHYTL